MPYYILSLDVLCNELEWVRRQSLNSWKSSMHSWDLVEIKQRKPTKIDPKTKCGSPMTMVYIHIWPSVLSPFPPGDGPGRWRIEEKKEELFKHHINSERKLLIMTAMLVLELDYTAYPKGSKIETRRKGKNKTKKP